MQWDIFGEANKMVQSLHGTCIQQYHQSGLIDDGQSTRFRG